MSRNEYMWHFTSAAAIEGGWVILWNGNQIKVNDTFFLPSGRRALETEKRERKKEREKEKERNENMDER